MVNTTYNSAISAYNQAAKMNTGKAAGDNDAVSIASPGLLGGNEAGAHAGVPTFPELVEASLDKATKVAYKGEEMTVKSLTDKAELHEMVTAITNAELSLETVVAVRDKMIGAYQDILEDADLNRFYVIPAQAGISLSKCDLSHFSC